MAPDGTLDWDAPPGRWLVIRLGHSCTGQTNHPPPPGMDGLEIDKLSKEAYDLHWEKGIKPYIDAVGDLAGRVFTTIHRDSPECGDHHWTPKMPAEFERRRGYSIVPFLPFFAGVTPVDQATQGLFRNDLAQTLADLTHEYNYDYSHELIRKHGMKSSSEAYSRVFSSTMAPRTADIPMTEVWLRQYSDGTPAGRDGMYGLDMTRTMAGVIQQHGQRYVGAEAFTQGNNPRFYAIPYEDHPGSAKWRGDQMMAEGVNRFYIHDYTHQPYLNRAPGVTYMGWGWNFDRNQTWWNLGSGAGAYWSRCHWMLQEGKADYDICVWSPNETFNCAAWYTIRDWKFGGYEQTFLGNDVFLQRGAVDGDGYFTTGPGLRYRILLGVYNQAMSVAELRKLAKLIEDGAVFIGGRPQFPKGLKEDQQEFNQLTQRIWGGADPEKGKPLGKGHVYDLPWPVVSKGPDAISKYIQGIFSTYLQHDFEVPGETIRGERDGFTFQHRRSLDAEWYFVSNQKPQAKRVDCIFRVSGKHPELWNPLTGDTTRLDHFEVMADGRLRVPLDFAPDGACFVVFRQPLDPSRQIVSVTGGPGAAAIADGHLRASANGAWEVTRADGQKRTVEIKGLPQPLAVSGPWTVAFQANRGAPPSAEFSELKSWSEHADPGIQHFSGEAAYRATFTMPGNLLGKNRRVLLDLGEVGVIAGVTLNGKTFTPLWTPPFRLDLTDALKAGENELVIRVANTWSNRIIGSLKNPGAAESIIFDNYNGTGGTAKGLTKDTPAMWTTFPIGYVKDKLNAGTPLTRSGLLGPVRLVCEDSIPLK
jgi:hypothetical protein